jgi:hypothetical protein
VIVAARIKGRLGFNPGKGVTVGQPADLDEEISLLTDDDDVGIAWMHLSEQQLDYDHCLAWWTGATLNPCPLTPDLVLSGRSGAVVMPSIQVGIMIPDPTDNSKFASLPGGLRTLYNPLPFTFVGSVTGTKDYWCSHFGNGNFLLRGPTGLSVIGGSMPSTGSTLSGGYVVWLDGNSDGTGHGATGPFVGRVFNVDSGTPTELFITATGPCAYRVNYELSVLGTTGIFGFPAHIDSAITVGGTGGSVVGGSDTQMVGDDSTLAAFSQKLRGTATITADYGSTVKVSCAATQCTITSISGRITLEAILAR